MGSARLGKAPEPAKRPDETIQEPAFEPPSERSESERLHAAQSSAQTLIEPSPAPPRDKDEHPAVSSAATIAEPAGGGISKGAALSQGAQAAAVLATPGRRIGPYSVVKLLGRGSMGTVLHAKHVDLGREVALKVLATTASTDPDSIERFRRESEAVARLDHPGIVRLFERGQDGDVHFYAMELVQGTSLEGVLRRERMPYAEVAKIVAQCAQALDYAHGAGILHRDVKPANVLLDKGGRARITDFGLARLDQKASLTSEGTVVGTPLYIAPEVAKGDRATRKSDIYSLGATLYELATGRPPYEGRDARTVMMRVLNEPPIPPTDADPRVPRDLVRIIAKAMARSPEERYPNARALANDLEKFATGRSLEIQGAAAFRESAAVRAGKKLAIGIVAGVTLVSIAGLMIYLDAKAKRLERENRALQRRAGKTPVLEPTGRAAVDDEALRVSKDRDVAAQIALRKLAEDAKDGNAQRSFDENVARAKQAEREGSQGTRATVLKVALDIFPHRWDARLDYARALAASDPDEAERQFTMTVLAPDATREIQLQARLERARFYQQKESAVGAWLAAADLRVVRGAKASDDPSRAGVCGDLAVACCELGLVKQASEVLADVVEPGGGDDLARLCLGRAALANATNDSPTADAELGRAREAATSDEVRRLIELASQSK